MSVLHKIEIAIILILMYAVERPQPRSEWLFASGLLRTGPLSSTATAYHAPNEADLGGDEMMECLLVEHGRAIIIRSPCIEDETDSQILWQSPQDWEVIQGMLTDLNRDGRVEAALLVWRPYQRWAIDTFLLHPGRLDAFQNDEGRSCHMILIGTKSRRPDLYRELWAGSAMAAPFEKFAAADITGDGHQEIVALESDYRDNIYEAGSSLTLWEWSGFGFSLMTRIDGHFQNMELILTPDGMVHIITLG